MRALSVLTLAAAVSVVHADTFPPGRDVQCVSGGATRYLPSDAAGAWTSGPAAPPALIPRCAVMVYDRPRTSTLLYGGGDLQPCCMDTWEYDGLAWTMPGASTAPGKKSAHAMVYDSRRRVVVMMGGDRQPWEYDGVDWIPGVIAPPAFGPRSWLGMAYDSRRGCAVTFGGYHAASPPIYYNDTWEYDGTSWLAGPTAPPALGPRCAVAMSFDAKRAVTVIFGGYAASPAQSLGDVWEYDGAGWTAGVAGPPPRFCAGIAWAEGEQKIALVAGGIDGCTSRSDLWFYDGLVWTAGPTLPSSPLYSPGTSYDPARSAIVVFGGAPSAADSPLNETWEYQTNCALVITPQGLADAILGTAYSQQISVVSGTTPITFSITWGSPPPGLTLSASGILSGTPTASGSFSFGVAASDGAGCLGDTAYVVRVCDPIDLQPALLPDGQVGIAYNVTITPYGGTPPYAILELGALPAGLFLSPGGVLSGTPTKRQIASFVVNATDSSGCSGSRAYDLRILGTAVDFVTGQGDGAPNPNRVRAFDVTGMPAPVDFLAYGAGAWGVNVASGDCDGGSTDEMFTGPGPGPSLGPQVRAFRQNANPIPKVTFYAYATLKFGVNVGEGDLDDDGLAEILSGAGPGAAFGPHVRGWNYDGLALGPMTKISFFAYGTLKFGVNAAFLRRPDFDMAFPEC
ncbi:MAG: Ig domain-containing protein [Acidobacteriota bacterium]